jgi:hypothetical protein
MLAMLRDAHGGVYRERCCVDCAASPMRRIAASPSLVAIVRCVYVVVLRVSLRRTITLSQNNLVGTLPTSLSLLHQLAWFEVADNSISGTIPMTSFSTNV